MAQPPPSFVENGKRVCAICDKEFGISDAASFRMHKCENVCPSSGKRTRQESDDDDHQPGSKRYLSDILSTLPSSSHPQESPTLPSTKLQGDDPDTLNRYLHASPPARATLARLGFRSLADIIVDARQHSRHNSTIPRGAIHPCALLAWLAKNRPEGAGSRWHIDFEDAVADGVLQGEPENSLSGGRVRYKWIGLLDVPDAAVHLPAAPCTSISPMATTAAPSPPIASSAVPFTHPHEPHATSRGLSPHKLVASLTKAAYPRDQPPREPFPHEPSVPPQGSVSAELFTLALNSEARLLQALHKLQRSGQPNVKFPVSALNELCQKRFGGGRAVFNEDQFATIRQWSVKLPAAAGAPTISVRGSASSESKQVKNICALKAIMRLCPSRMRTWGDVLLYLEQTRSPKTWQPATHGVTGADEDAPPIPDGSGPSEQRRRVDGFAFDEPQEPSTEMIDLMSSEDDEEEHPPPRDPSAALSSDDAVAVAGDGDELLAEVAAECVRRAGGTVSLCTISDAWRRHARSDEIETALMSSRRGSSRLSAAQQWLERSCRFVVRGQSFMATVALAHLAATRDPPPAMPPPPPQPPPLPPKMHERCRFLRITNLPSDYTEIMARALVKVTAHIPPSCTVEGCQMEASTRVALLEMSCTREATTMRRRLTETPLRGVVLEVIYDPARAPGLAVVTTDNPSAMPSQPPRPLLSLPDVIKTAKEAGDSMHQKVIALRTTDLDQPPPLALPTTTNAHASATNVPVRPQEICQYSYTIGHTDAARDIEANATAQVETLRKRLDDERQAELARLSPEYQRQSATDARPMLRAGSSHASAQMDAGSSSESSTDAAREERLVRRQLALRQYVEMRRAMLGNKATAKPWRLTVRRHALLEDVLPAFGALSAKKRATLFCTTAVTFLNHWGDAEDGQDNGGLTAEMFALFWSSVLAPESGLFSGEHLLLPSSTASSTQLEGVGMALCKCLLDDHPIGFGFARFLFAWLVHGEEADALHDTHAALRALDDVDPRLSATWRRLLAVSPSQLDSMELSLESFVRAEGDAPVTAANLETALLLGCRQRLLEDRRDAMCALRHGFVRCEDLTVQLGAFDLDELTSILQGQVRLSAEELLACFALPSSSEEEAREAGFDDVGSRAAADFEELLRDGSYLSDQDRLTLLNWCTALTVLPFGGLRDHKIRLRLYGQEVDDATLPETHTCTREVRDSQLSNELPRTHTLTIATSTRASI